MSQNIITKHCCKCKNIKPRTEFHKNRSEKDGLHGKCKECVKTYQRSDNGKAAKQRASKVYANTEKGKAALKRAVGKYRVNSPEKKKAKNAVARAIENGKLPRPDSLTCSCGQSAQQYHHLDYISKEGLNIVQKCVSCHKMLHTQ